MDHKKMKFELSSFFDYRFFCFDYLHHESIIVACPFCDSAQLFDGHDDQWHSSGGIPLTIFLPPSRPTVRHTDLVPAKARPFRREMCTFGVVNVPKLNKIAVGTPSNLPNVSVRREIEGNAQAK
jgi:hypothetical protein